MLKLQKIIRVFLFYYLMALLYILSRRLAENRLLSITIILYTLNFLMMNHLFFLKNFQANLHYTSFIPLIHNGFSALTILSLQFGSARVTNMYLGHQKIGYSLSTPQQVILYGVLHLILIFVILFFQIKWIFLA